MDSKFTGGNIALFSRYEMIHHTLGLFCKTLDKKSLSLLSTSIRDRLDELMEENTQKTVYRQTRDEIIDWMKTMAVLMYQLIRIYGTHVTVQCQLHMRVVGEQYKLMEDQEVELCNKEELRSSSVQSPHDLDSAYRH